MSRYTFYSSLGLDRDRDPQQLAAQLDQWLKMPGLDRAQVAELQAARAILGNPVKRTEYDRRIDDPSAPDMTMAELQELAARQSAPGWGRPDAGAPSVPGTPRAGASVAAASVTDRLSSFYRDRVSPAVSQAYGKTKEVFRTHPKPAIAVTTVAALAVVGIGVVGAKTIGGGDDGDSSGYSGSSWSGSGSESSRSDDDGDRYAEVKDQFKNYDFLKAGEELTFTTGELYTYDDGHTERSPEGGEFGVTVDNVRTIDAMTKVDPAAPANHPDATSHKGGTLVCYDVTYRVIKETAYALEAKEKYRDYNPLGQGYVSLPDLTVSPIVDKSYLGNSLGSTDYTVPPGSTAPIVYDEEDGWGTEDGADKVQHSPDKMSETLSECRIVAQQGTGNRRGVTADGSEPENYSGYVVSASVNESAATPSKDVRGWRFDH